VYTIAVSFIIVAEDFHGSHTLKIISETSNKKLVKIALLKESNEESQLQIRKVSRKH